MTEPAEEGEGGGLAAPLDPEVGLPSASTVRTRVVEYSPEGRFSLTKAQAASPPALPSVQKRVSMTPRCWVQ